MSQKLLPLDILSTHSIRLTDQRYRAVAMYYWEHYCYFAHERSLIIDKLKSALAVNCQSFQFSNWQRAISYQFCLEPLSAKGSILNDPGGRFNIGDIEKTKFAKFPALYLASNRETAYKEKYGLYQDKKKSKGLSAEELALTSNDSIAIVAVQGQLNQVLDIGHPTSLKDFFNLIKAIKLPNALLKKARKLNIAPLWHIRTLKELKDSLLAPIWRTMPMLVDIPANSQILGQIAHAAGIEAILYPSRITQKNCLAIFPENLAQSESYVEIEGVPPENIKWKRLDANTFIHLI